MKINRPGLCACAAAVLTPHKLQCHNLLSYICVTVSTGSSLHQSAVMSSAEKGMIFYFLYLIHSGAITRFESWVPM